MSFYDRPEADPQNGPNRLFLDIPRLGIHAPLPPEYKPSVLETEEVVIEIANPEPGKHLSIPRLNIEGTIQDEAVE